MERASVARRLERHLAENFGLLRGFLTSGLEISWFFRTWGNAEVFDSSKYTE